MTPAEYLDLARDSATGEYTVRVRVDSKRQPTRDYFTDDRDDAEATFAAMVREERARGRSASRD